MAALNLSELAMAAVDSAEDVEGGPIKAVSIFISYQDDAGVYHAIIHAPCDLKALCHETILHATEAAHKPADGLH